MSFKTVLYKCQHCSEPMEAYNVSKDGVTIPVGFVCMKEGCTRYGLVAITARKEEIVEG